jgi:hypothetical protein
VVGPTAGRYYIDITSGVPPKQFVRGEWFIGTALLTGVVWLVADAAGANAWLSAGIAFVVGYSLRVTSLYRGWEEPLAREPKGVYNHDDGRPLLGRKLQGRSQRELRGLGLLVEPEAGASDGKEGEPGTDRAQRRQRRFGGRWRGPVQRKRRQRPVHDSDRGYPDPVAETQASLPLTSGAKGIVHTQRLAHAPRRLPTR